MLDHTKPPGAMVSYIGQGITVLKWMPCLRNNPY